MHDGKYVFVSKTYNERNYKIHLCCLFTHQPLHRFQSEGYCSRKLLFCSFMNSIWNPTCLIYIQKTSHHNTCRWEDGVLNLVSRMNRHSPLIYWSGSEGLRSKWQQLHYIVTNTMYPYPHSYNPYITFSRIHKKSSFRSMYFFCMLENFYSIFIGI